MNTLTVTDALPSPRRPAMPRLAAVLAAIRCRLAHTPPSAAALAAALLARADQYHATQPSYAADLRAAARKLASA